MASDSPTMMPTVCRIDTTSSTIDMIHITDTTKPIEHRIMANVDSVRSE